MCSRPAAVTLTLKSADPAAAPAIHPNYLATPEDRRVAADAIRVTRKIVAQPALRPYSPVEYLPGPQVRDDDEAGLVKAAGDIGTTIFHPVGTARMGRADDAKAVVDARLKVIGIDGLRVADASVMPSITSGNTNSPTMMIAEKGAAMILEDGDVVISVRPRESGDPVLALYVAKELGSRFRGNERQSMAALLGA